ncbi:TrkH family potassium uptake protein [bacterium]|nr:TrkH family potassium uptake protein [bacterium]
MNLQKSSYLISKFVTYFGFFLLAPLLVFLFPYESSTVHPLYYQAVPFVLSSIITVFIGKMLSSFFYNSKSIKEDLTRKDGFLLASLIWLFAGIFGSLPYIFSSLNLFGFVSSPIFQSNILVNSIFESISGITTTGATALSPFPEVASHQFLIFWRSLCQWLGGIGIILLVLVIFPRISVGVMQIATDQEGSGPQKERITPRLYETGITLLYIYIGLSLVLGILLYSLTNLNLFDSIIHTLSTVSSGGFSSYPLNLESFDSLLVESIVVFFMFLAGISFAVFYFLITGNYKKILENSEFKAYVLINLILIISVVFTVNKFYDFQTFYESLRYGIFQSVSLSTGTGFTSYNFDLWSKHTKIILLIFMILGGCSGSTTGGIKIIRLLIIFKRIVIEIKRRVSPNIVSTVKINGKSIDEEIVSGVFSFMGLYIFICTVSAILIIVLENNVTAISAFSAVLSCITNVGPGFEQVNPHHHYAFFSTSSKILLSFLMLLGRLEIFTIFALLIPSFWKKY